MTTVPYTAQYSRCAVYTVPGTERARHSVVAVIEPVAVKDVNVESMREGAKVNIPSAGANQGGILLEINIALQFLKNKMVVQILNITEQMKNASAETTRLYLRVRRECICGRRSAQQAGKGYGDYGAAPSPVGSVSWRTG